MLGKGNIMIDVDDPIKINRGGIKNVHALISLKRGKASNKIEGELFLRLKDG